MILDYENRIYLSKRNLLTLLSKLERFEKGEETKCTIIKNANPLDPYCQSMDQIAVIAIPDEHYYTKRNAGPMHPADEANIKGK
jgi:hypothetical protein